MSPPPPDEIDRSGPGTQRPIAQTGQQRRELWTSPTPATPLFNPRSWSPQRSLGPSPRLAGDPLGLALGQGCWGRTRFHGLPALAKAPPCPHPSQKELYCVGPAQTWSPRPTWVLWAWSQAAPQDSEGRTYSTPNSAPNTPQQTSIHPPEPEQGSPLPLSAQACPCQRNQEVQTSRCGKGDLLKTEQGSGVTGQIACACSPTLTLGSCATGGPRHRRVQGGGCCPAQRPDS